MRVLIAGAAGTLGLPLVQRLARDGHTVIGLTRSAGKRHLVESAGAQACVADALIPTELSRAVKNARPTHVVNLLTAIPPSGALRPKDLRPTNKLRTEGAANLLQASLAAGVQRIVAESFVAVYGHINAHRLLREDDEVAPILPRDSMAEIVLALRSLEQQHASAAGRGRIEAVVLRYGFFYGPAVPSTQSLRKQLQSGKMFFAKNVQGKASWLHIEDAVNATVAALTHPRPARLYNIADDQPLGMWDALMCAAEAWGTRPPRSAPLWLLRWAAPLVMNMTSAYLGLDNAKAKRELKWRPTFPTLPVGFKHMAQTDRKAA